MSTAMHPLKQPLRLEKQSSARSRVSFVVVNTYYTQRHNTNKTAVSLKPINRHPTNVTFVFGIRSD
jgi:hypothetical protein